MGFSSVRLGKSLKRNLSKLSSTVLPSMPLDALDEQLSHLSRLETREPSAMTDPDEDILRAEAELEDDLQQMEEGGGAPPEPLTAEPLTEAEIISAGVEARIRHLEQGILSSPPAPERSTTDMLLSHARGNSAADRFLRRATHGGGEAEVPGAMADMYRPRSESEIMRTLDGNFFLEDFDSIEHILENLPTRQMCSNYEGYLQTELSEKDIAKDHIMGQLGRSVRANSEALVDGMKMVADIDSELRLSHIQISYTRHKLDQALSALDDRVQRVLLLRRRRAKLVAVRGYLDKLRRVSVLEDTVTAHLHAREYSEAIKCASGALNAVSAIGAAQMTCLGGVRERLRAVLLAVRDEADGALEGLCLEGFDAAVYASVLRSHLILDAEDLLELSSHGAGAADGAPGSFPQAVERAFLRAIAAAAQRCARERLGAAAGPDAEGGIELLVQRLAPRALPRLCYDLCRSFAALMHTHYLMTQWHLAPFDARNGGAAFLHRSPIDHGAYDAAPRPERSRREAPGGGGAAAEERRSCDLVGLGLRRQRQALWRKMVGTLTSIIASVEHAEPPSPAELCALLLTVEALLCLGCQFCGEAQAELEADLLRGLLRRRCREAARAMGAAALEAIGAHLSEDAWAPVPDDALRGPGGPAAGGLLDHRARRLRLPLHLLAARAAVRGRTTSAYLRSVLRGAEELLAAARSGAAEERRGASAAVAVGAAAAEEERGAGVRRSPRAEGKAAEGEGGAQTIASARAAEGAEEAEGSAEMVPTANAAADAAEEERGAAAAMSARASRERSFLETWAALGNPFPAPSAAEAAVDALALRPSAALPAMQMLETHRPPRDAAPPPPPSPPPAPSSAAAGVAEAAAPPGGWTVPRAAHGFCERAAVCLQAMALAPVAAEEAWAGLEEAFDLLFYGTLASLCPEHRLRALCVLSPDLAPGEPLRAGFGPYPPEDEDHRRLPPLVADQHKFAHLRRRLHRIAGPEDGALDRGAVLRRHPAWAAGALPSPAAAKDGGEGDRRLLRLVGALQEPPAEAAGGLFAHDALEGVRVRSVAAESAAFVANVLAGALVRARDRQLLPGEALERAAGAVLEAVAATEQLSAFLYRCAAQHSLGGAGVARHIGEMNWDIRGIREGANDYVDEVLRRAEAVQRAIGQEALLAPAQRSVFWAEWCQSAMEALVEGFSRVKHCSTEGRALMSMDVQALHQGLTAIAPFRGVRSRVWADSFVKAFYYGEEDVMKWIADNFANYHMRHIEKLILHGVGKNLRKKRRNELLREVRARYPPYGGRLARPEEDAP